MLNIVKAATVALRNDRSAAGALEYALLVSFIAVAVIAGATSFGNALSKFFTGMGTAVGLFAT